MKHCDKHDMFYRDWCPECSNDARRDAQHNPHRTDFSTWDRKILERFAREAADENQQLKESVALLQAAWRKAVVSNAQT